MSVTGASSMARMRSPGLMPAWAAGVSSIGEITLTSAVLHRHLHAEPAELAAGLHHHLADIPWRPCSSNAGRATASMPLIAPSTSCLSVTGST